MPDTPTSQLTWSAKAAGDSIVIVTTDVRFDKRVRRAFRGEAFELLSIADFEVCSEYLTRTACAIEYIQDYPAREPTFRFKLSNKYWSAYPLIGIYSEDYDRQKRNDPSQMCVMGPRYRDYDYHFTDPVSDDFLVSITKRLIAVTRNPGEDRRAYRI